MAKKIIIDDMEIGSNIEKFYDFNYVNQSRDYLTGQGYQIEEEISSGGQRGFVVSKGGSLFGVVVTVMMDNDYLNFMMDEDEDGSDVADSVMHLYYLMDDSKCEDTYQLFMYLFHKDYLKQNSLDVDPIVDVLINQEDDNDDDIYIGKLELKMNEKNDSNSSTSVFLS